MSTFKTWNRPCEHTELKQRLARLRSADAQLFCWECERCGSLIKRSPDDRWKLVVYGTSKVKP